MHPLGSTECNQRICLSFIIRFLHQLSSGFSPHTFLVSVRVVPSSIPPTCHLVELLFLSLDPTCPERSIYGAVY